MSKVTLQDTNFDAEIYYLVVDNITKHSTYLPLDLASVTYFEITDDLLNFGLTGNITFPNWSRLLDKLKLGSSNDIDLNNSEQYIAIKLVDANLPSTDFKENGYEFLASAKSSASLMSNVVDVKQTLDFEEEVTSSLKKISWEIFSEANTGGLEGLTDFFPSIYLLEELLSLMTNDKSGFSKSLTERGLPASVSSGVKLNSIVSVSRSESVTSGNNAPSISLYELIQNILNYTLLGEGGESNLYSLPLVKTNSKALDSPSSTSNPGISESTASGERIVEIREMLSSKHIEFMDGYIEGGLSGDYSDVYAEEFVIAPSESLSVNASIHNNVESYDLVQPDLNNLRQTIWGSYKFDIYDSDVTNTVITEFNEFINVFEERLLNGNKSNIPSIAKEKTKLFNIVSPFPNNDVGATSAAVRSKIISTVLKSFIYLNETIILNVKGKLYRKPGMFITIKSDMFKLNSAEELWYVIEVKHKFINGNYQNEIKAVRFLAGGKEDRKRRATPDKVADDMYEEIKRQYQIEQQGKSNTEDLKSMGTSVDVTPNVGSTYLPGSTQATEMRVDPIMTPGKS